MKRQALIKPALSGDDAGTKKPRLEATPEKNGTGKRLTQKNRKDVTICFRTSSDIRNYLETIGLQNRQSLSYVIESLIHHHQQDSRAAMPTAKERRRYNRKPVALPALVGSTPAQGSEYGSGTVLDISLGGIRFVIPKKASPEIRPDDPSAEYSVIFTLPDQRRPIRVRCRPQNVSDTSDEVCIGANFVDADFNSYQNLQKYLI
jgi:hypothetical protein